MKTGMSKFTKGCLMTALVTFIIGCLICGIAALFGGFRVLRDVDVMGITGIPFHYTRTGGGGLRFGFGWDDDWDDDFNWSKYEKWNQISESDGKVELELTADTLRTLYIELGACELHIMESTGDHVEISIAGNTKRFRYMVEDGDTLKMIHRTGHGVLNWSGNGVMVETEAKVYLYLPKGTDPEYMDIELGAGSMESVGLQARKMDIEVGAGECSIDGLTAADGIGMSVGAGRVTLDALSAGELDLDVGAGELHIAGAQVERKTDLELGMGKAELSGLFSGNMDIDCGMGDVELSLDDAEEDHNYEIECSMGNVRVGSRSYTGLADEVSISNGSSSTYQIECSMGNVHVDFAE